MKRFADIAVVLSLACALALPAAAQEKKPEAKPADLRTSVMFQIKIAEDRLIQLAEATPAEKFAWRPAEGVRSIGEVYAHVTSANYFIPTFWGAKVPDGIDPRGFEKNGNDKAGTIAAMKKSFEHLRQVAGAMTEAEMNKDVDFFGNALHGQDILMVLASHAHEHLGQAIAYARSNSITPPWSRRGGE